MVWIQTISCPSRFESPLNPDRMPKVTFIEHDGTVHDVDAKIGQTLMEAALRA